MNDVWVTSTRAAELLSEVNHRSISPVYVRTLAKRKRIQYQPLDLRTNLYYAPDCQRKIKPYAHKKRGVKQPA